jgi:hypothetical protein
VGWAEGLDAEQLQDHAGAVPGEVAAGVFDVVVAGEAEQRGDQVSEGGHGVGAAGGDLGAVFAEGHVADVVVGLDLPVAADERGQFGGGGLVGVEAGDAEHPGGDGPVAFLLRAGQLVWL